MTFPQRRTQSRLGHALRTPADGTSVTTVAHCCGWSSASVCIDVFRRPFGYTPRQAQPPFAEPPFEARPPSGKARRPRYPPVIARRIT